MTVHVFHPMIIFFDQKSRYSFYHLVLTVYIFSVYNLIIMFSFSHPHSLSDVSGSAFERLRAH